MKNSLMEEKGIRVNSKIYPLEIIESAAYVFTDRAYIILDGDPENEVIVMIKPKQGYDKRILESEFHNELLNYKTYARFSDKNKELRLAILQRALVTNNPALSKHNIKNKKKMTS